MGGEMLSSILRAYSKKVPAWEGCSFSHKYLQSFQRNMSQFKHPVSGEIVVGV
jgi:hypothetical protein